MNILGISCYYHDAAAVLVRDGVVVAAVEEERFTRRKHDSRFPVESIRYCLEAGKITAQDIESVCFYEKPFLKMERMLSVAKRYPEQSDEMVQRQLAQALNERLFLDRVLARQIGYSGPIDYVDHHLAHAASSYFISPFEKSVILTIDGVGEWTTTAVFKAEGNRIEKLREIRYPHSLGLLYSVITAFLGFKVNNDEYKVMGLASYGKPVFADKIRQLIRFRSDGSFTLDLSYFSFMYNTRCMYNDKFIAEFGAPRAPESELTDTHRNLAASIQEVLEESVLKLGRAAYDISGGITDLCLAGGVALNCVANSRLMDELPFKRCSIQPAAGDGGGAMGAALYCYYNRSGKPWVPVQEHTTLLGPEFSKDEIKSYLDSQDAAYTDYGDAIYDKTAELIEKNKIIGWFQGRMEYGPRALGNRSIVANACHPDMKEILNARVKFREDFRPFAPAVLAEKKDDYFDIPFDSPYMLFTPKVRPGKETVIPSVTHFDNTARIQTVSESNNPRFHKLINAFGKRTGVPVVINTSFNIRGEPIVCTPDNAYKCLLRTGIDVLVIDTFLVEKEV
ncbi:MAG: carbamoyltransferase N-terminal domain-containing protein [Fibrobacterota bacterium]